MRSQNMLAAHYNKRANIRRGLHWQETMARLHGPIVSELNLLFATDWFYESGEMLPDEEVVRSPRDTSGTYECQPGPRTTWCCSTSCSTPQIGRASCRARTEEHDSGSRRQTASDHD